MDDADALAVYEAEDQQNIATAHARISKVQNDGAPRPNFEPVFRQVRDVRLRAQHRSNALGRSR